MKNSIKERAKKVPKWIKFKVALGFWWRKLLAKFFKKADCEHPINRREYYREGCYKCWECLKITVEKL